MRIVTQINDEDYIAFNKAVHFKSDEGRKSLNKYVILYSILLGFGICCFLLNLMVLGLTKSSDYSQLLPFIVIIIYFVFVLVTLKSRVEKRIRKKVESYRRQGQILYDSESTIDLTDEMIMEYTPKSTTRREWRDVKAVIMDEGHYYLMYGPMQGLIVPFRCLGEETNTFLPYVLQRTGLGVIK